MAKQKIRIVVDMFGGTIQGVHTDAKGVELDVVFLEDRKYASESGEDEFPVKAGPFKDQIVWTHHGESYNSPKNLDPVFKAAEERLKDRESGE